MKWSTPLVALSIGTRATDDQLVPVAFRDLLNTMSLALQLPRKRQSAQATKPVPARSISAVGSGPSRKLPATVWCEIVAMVVAALHDAPPLVELKAPIAVSLALAVGTMTVPVGVTSGWPPMTPVLLVAAADHVRPPSVDLFIWRRLPLPWSSHSV